MTRGRKKDLTIPPTRALVQQRDYRARKAHYVADLEERCRKAEAENAQLRKDLAAARAGLALPAVLFSPETAQASTELMQQLTLASASLSRFQQLAFSEPHFAASRSVVQNSEPIAQLRPASFPSPAPSPSYSQPPQPEDHPHPYFRNRKRLHREDSPQPDPPISSSISSQHCSTSISRSRSSSLGSNCCGGIMDCTDLVEREESIESEESGSSMTRLSGLRSTSSRFPAPLLHPGSS
ncbi:hypothetical protein BDQ17DRAFT_1430344 [Cyathus striatus]|nr:hypothetical protein BDQ17DRAFT_1430344 [Cyathus striatus]